MTRENKLALVIGFGLLLFVGILISDHLSAANRQDSADLTAGREPAAANWEDFYDLQDYGPAGQRTAGHVEVQNQIAQDHPVEPEGDLLINRPGGRHSPAAPPAGTSEWTIQTPGIATQPAVETPASEPASNAPTVPGLDPLYTTHTVARGESLASISKRYYGNESMVQRIAQLNNLSNPDVVRLGATLKLPRAGIVNMINTSAGRASEREPTTTPTSGNSGDGTYTIKPGDVLSEIASRQMGSARLWRKLFDANRDVLKDPDNIPAGVTIRIPR